MSERHWQRPALASTALALLGATAVAGCGGSASSSQASANQTAGAATATAQAPSLTAAQLKGALLTQISGAKPGNKLPAGCEHYTASVGGKTFHYSVKESPISGLGNEARALNVKAAGYS